MNILYLTLHKKWFDQIKDGTKTIEYREIKPYWTKRLEDKFFDAVHFRNGYSKSSPTMLLKCRGIIKTEQHYEILLGEQI